MAEINRIISTSIIWPPIAADGVTPTCDIVARLPLALGRACSALSGESLMVDERMTGACVSLDEGHF